MLLMIFFQLFGCDENVVYSSSRCELQITDIAPTPITANESAQIVGYPFTKTWDSLATIDGTEMEVTTITRENCTDCDECREINFCSPCDDCDICDQICKNNCVETMEVVIPANFEGSHQIQVSNSYGQSLPQPVEIQAEESTQ